MYTPTLEQARELLYEHNKEDFHRQHGEAVSGVMAWFAKKYDPENVEYWAAVGMLHDLDFEKYPDEHCVKAKEMMGEIDINPDMIRSVCSHGWGMTGSEFKPESTMEKILFAVDELTGLIGAAALVRPSKSTLDMELKSLKKKFKDKAFAAGCSRETIRQGAEQLGWELDELLSQTLEAMQSLEAGE